MRRKYFVRVRAPRRGLPLKDAFKAPSELTNEVGRGMKTLFGRKWLK